MMDLTLAALIAIAPTLSDAHVAPACGATPPSAPARISADVARQRLNDLLVSEGLTRVREPVVAVRSLELDDDPSTVEALVDVLTPEHCGPTLECTTIVVQRSACNELRTIGHGRWLQVLVSRSNGWADLVETGLLPIARRALRFESGRYR